MAGELLGTQAWADAGREYSNKDELTRKTTKGLTQKIWYVGLEWPGHIYGQPGKVVDVFFYWRWTDGFMDEFVIEPPRPAPNEEWRGLKFDKKGWWGGFTCGMNPALDAINPVGDPVKTLEPLLAILSDPRVRVDQSATAAYKILKQLQGWLDGLARAHKALGFVHPPEYVAGSGPAPRP